MMHIIPTTLAVHGYAVRGGKMPTTATESFGAFPTVI